MVHYSEAHSHPVTAGLGRRRRNPDRFLLLPLLFWLGVGILLAPATGRAQGRVEVNYQQMRNDIEIFEAIVNQALGQLFPNPFALVDRCKGVFLNDYGVTVSFLVNIKAATTETPFGTMRRPETADPREREQKIVDLRERLVGVIADYGNAINQLKETDSIAIVAYIVDQNITQASRNRTVVLRAFKRDIAARAARQMDPSEFKKRIRIIEY